MKIVYNREPDISSTGFAGDLIIKVNNKNLDVIKNKPKDLYIKIKICYKIWKSKFNEDKFKTLLFRPKVEKMHESHRHKWRNFAIKTDRQGENTVPHKKVVKYLGINIDCSTKINKHVEIQLKKAKQVYLNDSNNVLILYHTKRNALDENIDITTLTDRLLVYSKAIPPCDRDDRSCHDTNKYWWRNSLT